MKDVPYMYTHKSSVFDRAVFVAAHAESYGRAAERGKAR